MTVNCVFCISTKICPLEAKDTNKFISVKNASAHLTTLAIKSHVWSICLFFVLRCFYLQMIQSQLDSAKWSQQDIEKRVLVITPGEQWIVWAQGGDHFAKTATLEHATICTHLAEIFLTHVFVRETHLDINASAEEKRNMRQKGTWWLALKMQAKNQQFNSWMHSLRLSEDWE